ncbi:uncharacterized protein [Drosophila bipectinata]|uniref:uncharacterized protein n=1 Tax=Drosophila bipectinata TaxID=42026 RepID=UPI0038B30425
MNVNIVLIDDEIYNIGCRHLFHKTCMELQLTRCALCLQCGWQWNGSQRRVYLSFGEPTSFTQGDLPYKWVPMQLGPNVSLRSISLPSGVVECGTDCEGHEAYVARVIKCRELLPASYVPFKKAALASTGGIAYWVTEDVEVLVLDDCDIEWVAADHGRYPPHAIPTGLSDTGEVTYTGRATFRNRLRIGKVHPSYKTMFIAHNHREPSISKYEVLAITPSEPVDR